MLNEEQRERHREYCRDYYRRNREKVLQQKRDWVARNPEARKRHVLNWKKHRPSYWLLKTTKYNARKLNREHTITEADIKVPDKCPVFGVPFEYNTQMTPTVDRIDSTKGYVPGNIQVISKLANMMKHNATKEQLRAFAKWVLNE